MQKVLTSTEKCSEKSNVYLIKDRPPTKKDSNNDGQVLYFHPIIGWTTGYWQNPHDKKVEYWTYCPDALPTGPDRAVVLEDKFDKWATDKFPGIEPSLRVLLRMAFFAGTEV